MCFWHLQNGTDDIIKRVYALDLSGMAEFSCKRVYISGDKGKPLHAGNRLRIGYVRSTHLAGQEGVHFTSDSDCRVNGGCMGPSRGQNVTASGCVDHPHRISSESVDARAYTG
jgi:hypothetical protein